jgi:Holliday junction resolvase RusA-like endonuclease
MKIDFENSIKIFDFSWIGKLVSFNRYLAARAIKRKSDGRLMAFMYATTEYKNLVKNLVAAMKQIKKEIITQYVDMVIDVSRWKVADTGNMEKPIGDALETAGIIKNDRQIRHIVIFRKYHKKGENDNLRVRLFTTEFEK